jgi:hypothetical protein
VLRSPSERAKKNVVVRQPNGDVAIALDVPVYTPSEAIELADAIKRAALTPAVGVGSAPLDRLKPREG